MKKALVVGFGISGKGAVKLLNSNGYEVSVYTDFPFNENTFNAKYVGNLTHQEALQDIELVVISPSIDNNHEIVRLAQKNNIPVIGEIELGYRYCKAKIIAITGTNGKTTTTKLIGEIINLSGRKAYTLGNIGTSFCQKADELDSKDVVVLEVSSFQLESIKEFCPNIAVCLNITPDHYERHKNLENYAMAKYRIFINQINEDYAILNYDDEIVKDFSDSINSKIYFVSTKNQVRGCYLSKDAICVNIDDCYEILKTQDIPLKGEYNYQNIMTAILSCKFIGVEDKYIIQAIKDFKLPRYRNEYICTNNGIRYFNDSKATNIDSTLKACQSMQGDTALIVGGYDKGISYAGFFDNLPKNIKHIIATGDNVYSIMAYLPNYHEYTFEITASLERAVQLASQKSVQNVLFSPTTSSFDRYSNYEERGEHFDMLVKSILNNYENQI